MGNRVGGVRTKMKAIKYTIVDTYAQAALILLTHANSRMMAWESNAITHGYIVATEEL